VVAQQREPLAADGRQGLTVPLDDHRVAQGEHLLVDVDQHAPVRVLQLEGVPQPHRLAVDQEGLVAVLVLDPVVVTEAEEPVAYEESHAHYGFPGSRSETPPVGRRAEPGLPAQPRPQVRGGAETAASPRPRPAVPRRVR
jgi:hypothetical protein